MAYPDFIAAFSAPADFSCLHFGCVFYYIHSGAVDPVHRVVALPNVRICGVPFWGTDEHPGVYRGPGVSICLLIWHSSFCSVYQSDTFIVPAE